MGLTNGALQLGTTALLSYQSALQVIGNNIANAGVDGYARQSPRLSSLSGVALPEQLLPGGGVALTSLQRHLDEALEARLRSAIGEEQQALTRQEVLSSIEALYAEMGDSDLSTLMSDFFNAFEAVGNNPGESNINVRTTALTAGVALADKLQDMRSQLTLIHDQVNEQIVDAVRQVNRLAEDVAELNVEVIRAESNGQGDAAALRDQRDGVLKQLAELMDIQTTLSPEGAVNVFVGNEPLVQGSHVRQVQAVTEPVGDRTLVSVRFADHQGAVTVGGGKIAGLLAGRDECVYGQIEQLDALAATLIEQVNRLHSQGQGLDGWTELTSVAAVSDATAALDAAGLPLTPGNGSFKLTVTKVTEPQAGQAQDYIIPVSLPGGGAGMSLSDLADYINNNVPNVGAVITTDSRLRLTTSGDYAFTFSEDSSGLLAGLGLNTFFTGTDASDIAVDANLLSRPRMLAASAHHTPGDGSNAQAIAGLAKSVVPSLGMSIPDQWKSVVNGLATATKAAKTSGEAAHGVTESLQSQRESISGVNLDEETVNLMRYQRSFQAAARYISLVDELVNEMLAMVR